MNFNHYKAALICFMVIAVIGLNRIGYTGQSDSVTVKVKADQSIRGISQEYLGNPDLWEDILRANQLERADEVSPGMILHIPKEAITGANSALENLKKLIRKATASGAKIFAPRDIARALQFRDIALKKRDSGEWAECKRLARTAADHAKTAYEISMKNHDVPAQAVVEFRQGQVHKRSPSDNLWKEAYDYTILMEGERVRTLSESYAEILFRDNSRLQLRENAQALIRKMRTNLLDETSESKVSLIQGDVLALLTGGQEDFKFEIDGVETRVNTRRFRAGRDDAKDVSWFAVDDEGELELKSGGKKVVLKQNQGSVVARNQAPSNPRELLPSTRLLDPPDSSEYFHFNINLTWESVKGADQYQIEISDNTLFKGTRFDKRVKGKQGKGKRVYWPFPAQLGPGNYYWRVTAVASDGLPGRISTGRFIRIIEDKEPPFLVVESPEEGVILSSDIVEISGNTEENAEIVIKGLPTSREQPVEVKAGGRFMFRYALSEGENHIVVKAEDQAGNISRLERTVIFLLKDKIDLTFDPVFARIGKDRFLVNHDQFTLSGTTYPEARIFIRNHNFSASGIADHKGRFHINLRNYGNLNTFIMEIVTLAGEVKKTHFSVETDNDPPVIRFDKPIPDLAAQKELLISGMLEGGASFKLNGQDISLEKAEGENETFSKFRIPLKLTHGSNTLRFEASDRVGNMAVVEKAVLYDSDGPRLISHQILPKKARGGETASLKIRAQDGAGLKKSARFVAQIGDFTYTGHIIRSASEGAYTAFFHIPKNVSGTIKLKTVTLSDYLGNTREVVINR